ncbi:polyprotein (retrotrasposon protein) [Pyrus ussuriensis x Pyrus communis]|uniref:Polyprotein (Retrotrasposon protein) n=1 Tax=Pyrus ussuriensis x Pyrus communis TaxID=2448454 RepID=A0A5N5FFW0_9ROSA|nr:polyprotein (retrotrasposon protein) [Pyrus ussuriensis x Pyrus communis]
MANKGDDFTLKLECGSRKPTNNTVLSPVVIQNDASAVPNTVKLNGSNFPLWSKVLEMHIAGHGRKGFVTRSTKEPVEDSAEYETCETGNAIVKSFRLRQDGWPVGVYYADLKFVWQELDQRRPIKMECVADLKTLQEEIQIDRVYAFLAGLMTSLIKREAQRHATMMGESNNQMGLPSMAMVSRPPVTSHPNNSSNHYFNSRPFTQENKDDLKCTFCGQTRHTEDTCFTKHRVPDWFPEFKKKLCAKERGVAGSSGGRASLITTTPTAQEAGASSGDRSQTLLTRTTPGDSSSNTGTMGRVLLASKSEQHIGWILDSGVTDHMTYDKNMFKYMTMSHRKSIVTANETLIPTKEIIASGIKRKRLYYMDDIIPSRANAVRASHDSNLQEVCYHASFPPSLNKRLLPFELVHFDVWGLSPVVAHSGIKWFVTFVDDCTYYQWENLIGDLEWLNLGGDTISNNTSTKPATELVSAENTNVEVHVEHQEVATKTKSRCATYPIANYVSCSGLAPERQTLVNNMKSVQVPTRVEEALKDPKWAKAMDEEMYSAYGNTGVCRLCKSLYGLKQSPRAWFEKFTQVMKKNGYRQSHSDHTLFVKRRQGKVTALIIYVDDMIITGDDHNDILKLQNNLVAEFEMKNLGDLKNFLGVEVARSSKGIFLSQRKYVLDLLKETGMLGCKPVDTLIVEKYHLCLDPNQKSVDKGRYQRLVGRLIYLAHTRPDIAYALRLSIGAWPTTFVKFWLRKLLWDLGFKPNETMKLYCDNKSARGIANNPVQHDRTKRVEVDRHFIKEKLEKKIVSIPFVKSEEQLVDVLTHAVCSRKFDDPLVKAIFAFMVFKISATSKPIDSWGQKMRLRALSNRFFLQTQLIPQPDSYSEMHDTSKDLGIGMASLIHQKHTIGSRKSSVKAPFMGNYENQFATSVPRVVSVLDTSESQSSKFSFGFEAFRILKDWDWSEIKRDRLRPHFSPRFHRGITLFDESGDVSGIWEFDFRGFEEEADPHVPESITLLKANGLDLDKLWKFGIDSKIFVEGFFGSSSSTEFAN